MEKRRLVIHIEYDHEDYDEATEVVIAQQRINEISELMQEHNLAAPWEFNYKWIVEYTD